MKAFNSRNTPKEHYLFREKGGKLSLTKVTKYKNYFGEKTKETYTQIFKIFRKDKKIYLQCPCYKKIQYAGELSKFIKKSKGTSITETIDTFKRLVEFRKYNVDVSKIERKYFVSRNIFEIEEILLKKGVLKNK